MGCQQLVVDWEKQSEQLLSVGLVADKSFNEPISLCP